MQLNDMYRYMQTPADSSASVRDIVQDLSNIFLVIDRINIKPGPRPQTHCFISTTFSVYRFLVQYEVPDDPITEIHCVLWSSSSTARHSRSRRYGLHEYIPEALAVHDIVSLFLFTSRSHLCV